MIIVSVRLLSAIDGSDTELARMHISNDGTGDARVGHYRCKTLRGRDTTGLDRTQTQRECRVAGFRKRDLHVWNLVAHALAGMGYGRQ